jgi:hypothetical protein
MRPVVSKYVRLHTFTAMKIYVLASWVVNLCSEVVGYQRFGGSYVLHLQVLTLCNDVGYQSFGGPCVLHLQVLTLCSDVVGYQSFGIPCFLHLAGFDSV